MFRGVGVRTNDDFVVWFQWDSFGVRMLACGAPPSHLRHWGRVGG
jgi:hypothetical protein